MLDFNHIYKVLATSFLETIGPTRCAVCDAPGEVLCADCARTLPFIDLHLACPRCGAPYGHVLCTECPLPGSEEALAHPEEAFPFAAARAALSFEDGARKLVRIYKDGDELRLGGVIASFLCAAMRGRERHDMFLQGPRFAGLTGRLQDGPCAGGKGPFSGGPCAGGNKGACGFLQGTPSRGLFSQGPRFTRPAGGEIEDWTQWADALAYVPASPEAVRRRGFDHMQRVAAICARRTGLPLAMDLEVRRRGLDQRELGRQGRIENKSGAFVARWEGAVPTRVILIDDVMTTGATLHAATRALLDAGASEVRVVVCCRVW